MEINEYSPFRKVGTSIEPKTVGDDINNLSGDYWTATGAINSDHGNFRLGFDATGTPGYYVSKTFLAITSNKFRISKTFFAQSGTNYNDHLMITASKTGNGTEVTAKNQDVSSVVNGISNFGQAVVSVTGGTWTGKNITVLFRLDQVTNQTDLESWLNQQANIGTGNYTVFNIYQETINAGGTPTSSYVWTVPPAATLATGSDPSGSIYLIYEVSANYNDHFIIADEITGNGTEITESIYDGTYLSFVDGVKNYKWFVMRTNSSTTDPTWANNKITVLANIANITDGTDALTWAQQHTKIGSGHVTIDNQFLSPGTPQVDANGLYSDYSWNLPGIGSYAPGSNPSDFGMMSYKYKGVNGTSCADVNIFSDPYGDTIFHYDYLTGVLNVGGTKRGDNQTLAGQWNIQAGESLIFGDHGEGEIVYDESGSGPSGADMFMISAKSADDKIGSLILLGGGKGGDVISGTDGNDGGIAAVVSGDGSDAKLSSDGDGGNGGCVLILPGSGGKKDGSGDNGISGDVWACYNVVSGESPVAQGNFLIGTFDPTGLTGDGGLKVANYVLMSGLKTGATQIAAGANVGELWVTNGHLTLPNGVVMIGIGS